MKITRLQKAKGYRIFRDFDWPATGLPDFARFNVIYGWNGSGKTSLSNIFRMVQRREAIAEGTVEIQVDQDKVSGADFANAVLPPVRTFNRDAVDRAVFESPVQQLPPVFFLGEDSVEKQKQIEELTKLHEQKIEAERRWIRKKLEASSALDTLCADEGKSIKNLLTIAGGGPYNNYNAATFKTDIQALAKQQHPPEPLTEEQRQVHLATKDGKVMAKVERSSMRFPDMAGLTRRTQEMLRRSVASAAINDLAEKPDLAAWVNTGLELHRGNHESESCHFCSQRIPEGRLQQLEAHFNDEFKRFTAVRWCRWHWTYWHAH